METKVYERSYYGAKKNEHDNDVGKFWVSRVRDNGVTTWRGGVLFATRTNGCIRSVAGDGCSWFTTLGEASRASKKRDGNAIKSLYKKAIMDNDTRHNIDGMLALESVNTDYLNEAWR